MKNYLPFFPLFFTFIIYYRFLCICQSVYLSWFYFYLLNLFFIYFLYQYTFYLSKYIYLFFIDSFFLFKCIPNFLPCLLVCNFIEYHYFFNFTSRFISVSCYFQLFHSTLSLFSTLSVMRWSCSFPFVYLSFHFHQAQSLLFLFISVTVGFTLFISD